PVRTFRRIPACLLILFCVASFSIAQDAAPAPSPDSTPSRQTPTEPNAAPSSPASTHATPQPPVVAPGIQGGTISGQVKSGNMPTPGATITAANTLTGQKAVTWADVNGRYSLQVPADGRYVVKAQMSAFATATAEVLIKGDTRNASADLEMVLQSRAQQNVQEQRQQIAAAIANRGFQSLAVTQGEGVGGGDLVAGMDQVAPAGMPVPGISPNSATESVAVSGNNTIPDFSTMSSDEMRQRVQEYRDQQGGG